MASSEFSAFVESQRAEIAPALQAAVRDALLARAEDPLAYIGQRLLDPVRPIKAEASAFEDGRALALSEERAKRLAGLHHKCRTKHPHYPARFHVPDEMVEWSVPWPDYAPVPFTAGVVLANDCTVKVGGWADPADPRRIDPEEWRTSAERRRVSRADAKQRFSIEHDLVFDSDGRPRNPRGRTGMSERGLLGKWGPNHAADPIVTRYDPARPHVLQMVAIRRKDTGEWAIPGGMVDPGESVSVTVRREFTEEAGNLQNDPARQLEFNQLVDDLFLSGEVVYRGYVDDPRNTDNAWLETTAFNFHCGPELGAMLPLHAGDDAADVMWLDVDVRDPKYCKLYASHRMWVDMVALARGRDRVQDAAQGSPASKGYSPAPLV